MSTCALVCVRLQECDCARMSVCVCVCTLWDMSGMPYPYMYMRAQMAKSLVQYCLEAGSRDNMSVILVKFPAAVDPTEYVKCPICICACACVCAREQSFANFRLFSCNCSSVLHFPPLTVSPANVCVPCMCLCVCALHVPMCVCLSACGHVRLCVCMCVCVCVCAGKQKPVGKRRKTAKRPNDRRNKRRQMPLMRNIHTVCVCGCVYYMSVSD